MAVSWRWRKKSNLTTFSGGAERIVLFLIAAYLLWKREVELIEREETRERHALLSAEEWHYYLYLRRCLQ